MGKIALLLIDDHKLIRESWSIILNADPRFEVVGETSDIDQALVLVKKLNPDIILMD
ncbi:MAG: response regulator, partial [Bacteroidota bacterium]